MEQVALAHEVGPAPDVADDSAHLAVVTGRDDADVVYGGGAAKEVALFFEFGVDDGHPVDVAG